MELKRILKQYAFSLLVICCTIFFFIGIVTVREKTRYNMDMTVYETVELSDLNSKYISLWVKIEEIFKL